MELNLKMQSPTLRQMIITILQDEDYGLVIDLMEKNEGFH